MNQESSSEYVHSIIDTTLQRTVSVSSAALMTITCFSCPFSIQGELLGQDVKLHQSEPLLSEKEQEVIDAIKALEYEKELYSSRAHYELRQADRIMAYDWISYKEHMKESIRYATIEQRTKIKIHELKDELVKMRKK